MMSEQGLLRRPVLWTVAGLVVTTLLVFAYTSQATSTPPTTNLQRSHAVRHPRHRWRRGFNPRDVGPNPIPDALQRLRQRIAEGRPYGRYVNPHLFDQNTQDIENGFYDLLPGKLGTVLQQLEELKQMSNSEMTMLFIHVEAMFVQNFLHEEFPAGYIFGDEDMELLVHGLSKHDVSEGMVRIMVDRFDDEDDRVPMNAEPSDILESWGWTERVVEALADVHPSSEGVAPQNAIEALSGPAGGTQRGYGWGDDEESDPGGSQAMLDLLYQIAADQAKREGFVHRGIECNSCGTLPIRGIRYHCANCYDFDICETCEAQQVHIKSHVFYKIRIPAPSRGPIKEVHPVWYPGAPNAFLNTLSKDLAQKLEAENGVERTQLDSYYEQFKCLAGTSMKRDADPSGLGQAIGRKDFDAYFSAAGPGRPPPQNLLYDRVFAFYDQNNDALITFDEFVKGMTMLQNRTRGAQVQRMFTGCDLDGDGFVDRKDFLRMFRAYYAWHKDLNREMVAHKDEDETDVRDAVAGTQPLSAAFMRDGEIGHASRGGVDKRPTANGDLEIISGPEGVLVDDTGLEGDRLRAIGNAAVRGQSRSSGLSAQQKPEMDEPVLHLPPVFEWSTENNARDLPSNNEDEVVDSGSYESVLDGIRQDAIRERWKRKQFYLDEEEGMSRPPGYTEETNSDDENETEKSEPVAIKSSPRRQSLRSRSSSKVRFDDSAIDTDFETRSNTSSRSIPVNERWGGFEFGEPERDIGKEIIYQAVQQGFNELLDPLFKQKEDEAMQAQSTRHLRHKWASTLDEYESRKKDLTGPTIVDAADAEPLQPDTLLSNVKNDSQANSASDDTSISAQVESPLQQSQPIVFSINQPNNDAAPTEVRDPTLPQFKSNEPFVEQILAQTAPAQSTSNINNSSTPPPSESMLETWLHHRRIDNEADVRGGHGRLDLRDFKQKLVEASLSEADKASGNLPKEDDELTWSSSADLGKYAFLGTWLELAHF